MFEALFGTELPLALRFFIAFLFVLGLIGGAAYLVRRFGAGALTSVGARGRQPRLAVVDSAPVDGRRRLVIIRRDNVEHLVMIGGPSDVVVETNIVRSAPAATARESAPVRSAPEPMVRHAPSPEANMWPLQPEPVGRPQRTAMEEPAWSPPAAEPAIRAGGGERATGFAADLSRNPPPEAGGAPPEYATGRSPDYVASRPAPEPRRSAPAAPPPAAVPVPPPASAPPASSDEQNLAEMAHRLEAALRRPTAPGAGPAPAPLPAPPPAHPSAHPPVHPPAPAEAAMIRPVPEPMMRPGPTDPPPSRPAAAEPLRPVAEPRYAPAEPRPMDMKPAEPKPREPKPQGPKTVYDSLEQEMASLLGRPSGKP